MVWTEFIMTDNDTRAGEGNKEAGSLSEILRLQAVALARMSERIAGQQEPEPHPVPAPRPPRTERRHSSDDQLPVLASDANLTEEALPVLNTFKKFLEAERRRARRRVLWASLALGSAFLVILGTLAWVGRDRLAELSRALGAADSEARASRMATESELRKVSQSAASLKQDLWRTVSSSQSLLSSNLDTKLSGREADVEQLKEKLSALEIENAMLIGRLKELADTTSRLQESYDALSARGDTARAAAGQTTNASAMGDTSGLRNLPLLIETPGYGRPVNLRVPLAP